MKKVLAFDIGGTNIRLAKINENFEIEQILKASTPHNNIDSFFKTIDELMSKVDINDVSLIGAGVPGVVNKKEGKIIDLPNVGIKNIDFRKHFLDKYNLNSFIRNDAEVACLAEAYLGNGKDYDRVFFITISTGLGGALVVNKENQDYITEIGHTAYKYKNLISEYEYLASGNGLVNLSKLNSLSINSSKELFQLIANKDEKAIKIKKEWLKILNNFIQMIDDSYMPDVYCLTGGVMNSKQYFFDELLSSNKDKNIKECFFKEDAGIIGAAIYAFKNIKNI